MWIQPKKTFRIQIHNTAVMYMNVKSKLHLIKLLD